MVFTDKIRSAIKAYLAESKMPCSELARRIGVSDSTISRWLNSPDAETIRASNFARIEPLIRPYLPAAPASAPGAHSQNTNGHGSVQVNGNGNTVVLAHRIDETEKAILSDDSIPADAKVRLIRKLKGMGGFVVVSSFLYGFLCLATPLGMWAATAAQPPGVRLLAIAGAESMLLASWGCFLAGRWLSGRKPLGGD